MKRNTRHCILITRVPVIAQTTMEVKLNGITEIIDQLLLMQRQSAWKAFFPPGGTGDTGGGGGGGGDTGGGGGLPI